MSKQKNKEEIINLDLEPENQNPIETQDLILTYYSTQSNKTAEFTEETQLLKESFKIETETAKRRRLAREDSNWNANPDVDYIDLEYFISDCRIKKDKESFNTAIRILEAIKKQVLGK